MKSDWEKLGASVTLKVFDQSTFTAEILAPRKYDILFYGQVIGRIPDLFAYWHSSQRNAPGLNIALYANKNVDKLLEDARKEGDTDRRTAFLKKFLTEIDNDTPAVFTYSPDFLYARGGAVRGMHIGLITTESERFLDIQHWYVGSERVWKWFAPSDQKK
jgi:peptide/nickel transport system substrate-binding protein